LEAVLPLIFALVAVGAVLYLSYLFSRYLAVGAAKINKSKYVKIIDRVVLGQDRLMLITMIGGKYYLIGSTSQSIQILAELDENEIVDIQNSEKAAGEGSFTNVLRGMLTKKQGDVNG